MARISDKKFYQSVGASMGKTGNMVEKYSKAIIEQLFKEINRGNEVIINRFATFKPKLVGGEEKMVNPLGVKKYIEPRIIIDMKMTTAGYQIMNQELTYCRSKKRLEEGSLLPYEKEILGIKKEKKDLKEIFDKVVSKYNKDDEDYEEEELEE